MAAKKIRARKRTGTASKKSDGKSAPAPAAAAPAKSRGTRRKGETDYQYRKRRYKELHPGASDQQARGHKEREHVQRRKLELRRYNMTTYEKAQVKKFAAQQSARVQGSDPDEMFEALLEKARERGYDAFKRDIIGTVKRLAHETKKSRNSRVLRIEGRAQHIAEMQEIADDWDIDERWLFYN